MELNTAWQRYTDPQLKKQIIEKLSAVKNFEAHLPAVVTIHDAKDVSLVYMSAAGCQWLGVSLDDITLSFQEYHSRFFNLDDAKEYVPKVTSLLARNVPDEIVTYFQQVRKSPDDPWTWHLSATKVWMRDASSQPLFFLTLSLPIDAGSHISRKVERLSQENQFLKKNHHLFNRLTPREKEMLKHLAQGASPKEISDAMFLSEQTVTTHKRNIRSKLNIQSSVDLLRFAQAFDLI